MEKKRILVTGLTENPGGVESFFINMYRQVDHSILQFDFIKHTPLPLAYENEFKVAGGTVFYLCGRRKNPLRHYMDYVTFYHYNAQRYSGIYCNLLSLANIDDLKFAKRYGIPMRIAHSHNNGDDASAYRQLRRWLHYSHQSNIGRYATEKTACSEAAGKWMFGRYQFTVVPNSIDISQYQYRNEYRKQIREQLKLSPDTLVLGTVGRLTEQKNPLFLVKLLKEIQARYPNSVFLHIGEGPLRPQLERAVTINRLEKTYRILGNRTDVCKYYSAMDAFIFPSVYEGFGIALLEAQAAGLYCFVSSAIPRETMLSRELCQRMAPKTNARQWADVILKKRQNFSDRPDTSALLRERGYDIKVEALKFQKMLLRGGGSNAT